MASANQKQDSENKSNSPEKRVQKRRQALDFEQLKLSDSMMAALRKAGFERPTSIQAGMIPLAMEQYDVVGQARTGTGKTAAFAIPIIEQLDFDPKAKNPQALVLVPTRELAVQVLDVFEMLKGDKKITCAAVYGGKPIKQQIRLLAEGAAIVVGTPGRVIDHLNRGSLDVRNVWAIVLDEADRMLDIGFRPDIEKILRRCPTDRQTMMLSATVPPPIARLAKRYMDHPKLIDFSEKTVAVETIDQFYFYVFPDQKFELLVKLLEREKPSQAIVFCRTKLGTESLYRRLSRNPKFREIFGDGKAGTIHGDMSQPARDRTMKQFRSGETQFLIATDVVGRGIDVTGISHIINFDVPELSDDYVHRVGRTGRMGREGIAFSFVSPVEMKNLKQIERRINSELELDNDNIVGIDFPDMSKSSKDSRRYRRSALIKAYNVPQSFFAAEIFVGVSINIQQLVPDDQIDSWSIQDRDRARKNLISVACSGITIDLFESICEQLDEILPGLSDPDMVLNNLERFFLASRSPLATAALFDRDRTGLAILCKIFAASQYLSDLLIRDREAYDALRLTEGQPVARSALIDDLCTETRSITDFDQMVLAIRRFKHREFLRIAYGDIIAGQQIRDVTAQISYVADAICQTAIDFCQRHLVEKFGSPQAKTRELDNCRFVLLALGKLGGSELNYSSDIDLIFVYESAGNTSGGQRTNRQFFDRLVQEFVKLLSEPSQLGTAYRVDFRLRPEGKQGPLTLSAPVALQYYEMKGRSWERQALVKARPIAGDIEFGKSFLNSLQPWIYQPRWSRVEIESMMALKRKIERQAEREGEEKLNVKTGTRGHPGY